MSTTSHVIDFNPYKTSTSPQHQLGLKYETPRGEVYRYSKVGAANITAGKLQVCPAPKTNHHNVAASAAAAINATKITVTLGNTAAVANEYAEGYLVANDNAPEGVVYRIKSHPAADALATLELTLDRPLVEAVTTASEFELLHNTWNGVVEAAVEERAPAGVPLVDALAGVYVWLKTRGVASVLAGDTLTLGAQQVSHASTAGAIDDIDTTFGTGMTYYVIGKAKVAGVSTEFPAVELSID